MKTRFLYIILLLSSGLCKAQERYKVIIDELYPDPTPSHGLPDAEYVELYNNSGEPVNLYHWRLSDNHSTAVFPADTLQAYHYIIVCSRADSARFAPFGKVLAVNHFPSLNNDGDEIILSNAKHEVIHAVNYNTRWYRSNDKKDGGYSLEMIDPDKACSGSLDWKASTAATGGTPGKENAVDGHLEDNPPLDVIGATVINIRELQVSFSQTVDSASAANPANYAINNDFHIIKAEVEAPLFRKADLLVDKALDTNQVYQLIANNINSCSGQPISKNRVKFGFPKAVQARDIIINEILFNPRSGGNDFVEIYNCSQKILDLKDLNIARLYGGTIEQEQVVSRTSRLFFPKQYLVITENPARVKSQYYCKHPDAFAEIDKLPSFPNSAGDAVLLNQNGAVIDEFAYSENDHNNLINNAKGISLERINPDAATQNPSNWQSASADAGFATPTYQNSQFLKDTSFKGGFTFSSTIISPDNDGRDDKLSMHYQFDQTGFIANISIYNSNGFLIRRLYQNTLLGTKGRLEWDGYGENHKTLATGIYIMFIQILNLNGERRQWKKAITIARKF